MVQFLRAHENTVAAGPYTVMPPDTVTIHAPSAPEIDGTTQTVRSDGKLSLRLLGEVEVAGLTSHEIASKLRTQLARYYVEPEVVVEVSRFRSQQFFVFGEVQSPGPKAFAGRDTVLRVLAQARPTFLAWKSQIQVIRPAPDGEQAKLIVDLDNLLRSGDAAGNILLQAGDIVYVPPTPLAWVGHRVRELLYPVEPAVRTYTAPAATISATRDYREGWGSDDDDCGSGFFDR